MPDATPYHPSVAPASVDATPSAGPTSADAISSVVPSRADATPLEVPASAHATFSVGVKNRDDPLAFASAPAVDPGAFATDDATAVDPAIKRLKQTLASKKRVKGTLRKGKGNRARVKSKGRIKGQQVNGEGAGDGQREPERAGYNINSEGEAEGAEGTKGEGADGAEGEDGTGKEPTRVEGNTSVAMLVDEPGSESEQPTVLEHGGQPVPAQGQENEGDSLGNDDGNNFESNAAHSMDLKPGAVKNVTKDATSGEGANSPPRSGSAVRKYGVSYGGVKGKTNLLRRSFGSSFDDRSPTTDFSIQQTPSAKVAASSRDQSTLASPRHSSSRDSMSGSDATKPLATLSQKPTAVAKHVYTREQNVVMENICLAIEKGKFVSQHGASVWFDWDAIAEEVKSALPNHPIESLKHKVKQVRKKWKDNPKSHPEYTGQADSDFPADEDYEDDQSVDGEESQLAAPGDDELN